MLALKTEEVDVGAEGKHWNNEGEIITKYEATKKLSEDINFRIQHRQNATNQQNLSDGIKELEIMQDKTNTDS